ncbi:MAG: hypothetical protein M0Z53_14610 [Thermaerobacter sp.]|nr:hypothetical protein [Thermaerobacter sp.]
MTLPPAVQRLFHRYHAERLDATRHAALIIPTVLEEGSLDEWSWLFATYGWDRLRDWLADPAHAATLSPRVEWFWTAVLMGQAHETPRWQGGNHRRATPPEALPDWWPDTLR